MTINSKSSKRK
jgi:hypothetical protein